LNQDQIWSQVQEELRFQLAKRTYDMWLKNTSVISADGSTFKIGVPSKLAKDWLEDRFSGLIQETLQAVTGAEVDIDFVISPTGHRPVISPLDDDGPHGSDNGNGHENGADATTEVATVSRPSWSATTRSSPMRRRKRWPRRPATATTRCSCMEAWAWARRT
jgi:chromosomal replication initiation ATPase DnaA